MPESLYIFRPTLGTGGADRVTLSLLRHLPRNTFSPTLVLMRKEGELIGELPSQVPLVTLGARSLWTAWLPLARLIRKSPPDVLFSTSSGANVIAALAHLIAGSSSRLVLSERNVLRTELSWKKKLQRWLKGALYPRADRITTVSQGVKEELASELSLDPTRLAVVYNPVVGEGLEKQANEPVRHPWFDQEIPVILSVGRLVPEKDHATLLRAFARLLSDREARLLILGEGPLRGELEELARRLGVDPAVSMPGFVLNPFKYMARSTLFVLSSRFEGLPGALIQAMACGVPVISTDCPFGPAEILQPADSGLLVPVGDPGRIAEEMRRLLADPELSRRLAEHGRAAAQRFTTEAVLGNYVEALG